ncbi:MAG TPA: 3-hydroxyacyl-CoA dehydrogenase NAD-binding domain-containing protein [Acidimicrobiia bacterium]
MTTTATKSAFRVERGEAGAVLWFDVPDSSVNVFRPDVEDDLEAALTELDAEPPTALVIASAKESFCVGADVDMLREAESSEQLSSLSRSAQQAMDRVAALDFPMVAAIEGDCLGAGLELALACDYRVAADTPSTRLGLPEVQLGLIPGAGGTVRLPRLIGIEDALDMILTGKRLRPDRAKKKGLVDDLVHPAVLIETAFELAGKKRRDRSVLDKARSLALTGNPVGRRIVFSKARGSVMERTHGNMPAPLRAIDVIRTGVADGFEAGLRAESDAFGELAFTPEARALIHLFGARSRTKDPVIGTPRPVSKVGVIGAGLMGAGITAVTVADAGVPVRLRDLEWEALGAGMRDIRDEVEGRRHLRPPERKEILARVLPTTGATGFADVDVVIEAVVEKIDVKHQVLAEMESIIDPEALFATNTSSIPIVDIAAKAEHPGRVLGMHYFSPVPQVPLLEVVAGPQTNPDAVATAVQLGSRQGKTVIVVNDGPGFYTSRILAPYLDEAARLLAEGAPIEKIDRLMTEFGFPLGPFRLLDEVGLDIGVEISEILQKGFGDRMEPNPLLESMVEAGRFGKKNGSGFYRYERDGEDWKRVDEVDESVYEAVGVEPGGTVPDDAADRMLLRMVNEALYAFGDDILATASDGDIGAVFGLGFPAHLGGPFHHVEIQRGVSRTLADLEDFAARYGFRFQPAPALAEAARSGAGFGTGEAM